MDGNFGTRASVLITDSALDSLAVYHGRSSDHALRVKMLVDALEQRGAQGRVLRLSGARRPLWQCDVDGETCAYVTMGQGADAVEARIAFFGSPVPENTESLKSLLFLTGESPYHALPETVRLEESCAGAKCPPQPERPLAGGSTLDTYLHPDDDVLLHALEQPAERMDDLHGRPFRLLKQVRAPVDLPARLSPQQKEMLTKPRPLFLQGVAGSGKTTLLTHFAHQELVRSRNEARILIVAYTESLKRFIERLLGSLRALDAVDLTRIEIRTWRELCGVLAAKCGLNPIRWADDAEFATFMRAMLMAEPSSDLTADVIPELQEILRAVLKGPDPQRALIPPSDFFAVPNLASDGFLDRRKVYDIAEQYQYFLHSRGLYDDLDAAQLLFGYRDALPKSEKYDYVLVDETQDYTLAQLRLLAALAEDPSGLVYAGDMNQVVYPSQFNWEKVRTAVYHVWKNKPPDVQDIVYNYRNPLPVSRIAGRLLEMRAERLDVAAIKSISNQAGTPMPLRVRVSGAGARAMIEQLAVQVGSLGVIQEAEEHLDVENIEFQRTFTPQSVKGLEFNVVCLVGFNGLYRELAVKGKRRLTPRQLLMKFNEVYVSTTRTRGQLLLIDSDAEGEGLWDSPPLCELVSTIEAKDVTKLIAARYKLTSRDDWRLSALDFESQQAFAPAGEAWERAGDHERAAAAYERAGLQAKACTLYKAIGSFETAARLAEELGDYSEAADLYAKAGAWERAADCCMRAGDGIAAAKAYERLAAATGDAAHWAAAGEQYARIKKLEEAARCYERGEQWLLAARCWKEQNALLKAAACYERGAHPREALEVRALYSEAEGDVAAAAQLWERAGSRKKAAACYERLGDLDAAQRLFNAAGDRLAAARLLRELGRAGEASQLYEAEGLIQRAVECHEEAGNWNEVAELREREGNLRRAAEAYARGGNASRAALTFEKAGDFHRAAQFYERAGEWEAAARNWRVAGETGNARRCFQAAGLVVPPEENEQDTTEEIAEEVVAREVEVLPPSPPIRFKPVERIREPERTVPVSRLGNDAALLRVIAEYLQRHEASPGAWEYNIAETAENREFVMAVRTAQHVGIASLASSADDIAGRLSIWAVTAPVRETIGEFREQVEEIAGRAAEEEVAAAISPTPAAFACLFEFVERFDLAAPLWERIGEKASAIRCYRKIGERDKARDLCRTVEDPELAVALLESAGFHAEAALRAVECDMYMRAASDLDLCGQNDLATIAKAVGFTFKGKPENARPVWEALGYAYSKEELLAELHSIVHPEEAPPPADAPPRPSFTERWRTFIAFLRRLFTGR